MSALPEKPLVSVFAPTYNKEKYIGECIESVLGQTYENLEMIVIDDGSQDRSYDAAKSYVAGSRGRLKVVKQETNRGICPTLNHCLELAKGRYISLIGADDVMLPELIETNVEFMERAAPEYAMVFTNIYYMSESGEFKGKASHYLEMHGGDIFADIVLRRSSFWIISSMIRAECLSEIDGFDENLPSEDLDLLFRLSRNHKIGYIERPLAKHRTTPSSMWGRRDEMTKMIEGAYRKVIEDTSLSPLFRRQAEARMHGYIGSNYYSARLYPEARRRLLKALVLDPTYRVPYWLLPRTLVPPVIAARLSGLKFKALGYITQHRSDK